MATPQTVLDKILDAANEAAVLAGQTSLTQQIQDLTASLAQANADKTTLQGKLDVARQLAQEAIDADTASDQQEAARLAALLAQIQ